MYEIGFKSSQHDASSHNNVVCEELSNCYNVFMVGGVSGGGF